MECKRCGNKDPTYFHYGSKGYYCRKCISFKRILIEEELEPIDYEIGKDSFEFNFSYPLTSQQIKASEECLNSLMNNKDVLLHCVCGAGKTEIVVKSISYYLSKGLKVCYAISRKEVVIELAKRFESIFTKAKVCALYGGHHDVLVSDLIVCTNHQLFRYPKTFDLLVLDEVDAFPLKGNDTLMNISLNSSKGQIIYSTATVDDSLRRIVCTRDYKEVNLYVRPSLKPLIVPKVYLFNSLGLLILLFYLMKKQTNQCIIFVTSKKASELLCKFYKNFFSCTYAYSDLADRNKNIKDFKEKKYQFCFSTTILERGITIYDVNVIVLNFIKEVFDESSLIQMLGRVGRNINNPYGKAYILTNHYDKEIKKAIVSIKKANSYL